MSDNQEPSGAPQPNDPWAPPAASSQDRVPLDRPWTAPQQPPSVHDQPTMIDMPGAPGSGEPGQVPPPPTAPGGPAPGQPGAPGYGYPGTAGYGYPGATMPPPPAGGTSGGFGAPADPYGSAYPGYATPYGGQPQGWGQQPANGLGIAGMVLGIIATALFCLWPLAIVLGILAVIFGAVGRGRVRRGEADNPGQAVTGIVCGVVGLVLGLVLLVAVVVDASNDDYSPWDSKGASPGVVVGQLR
ncbi:DUF4190 domain-containing protein [Streptomyces zhihengii]|uniref:DUF4190 domain-containing protein n=1 Tax=Streptomyces zhihengii TaxID=1818004 RepID=A0ABS2UNM1_9ACTN|nr:DUF4190 domain-containing protein [Streptomyces zhihengii]MBM9619060.1 DUF4190 domain-containing protein [Streptomyces zhihengii]